MKKLLGRLMLVGAVIGGVVAARNYLSKAAPARETVQVTFDDGSTRALAANTDDAQELTDLARNLIEIGV